MSKPNWWKKVYIAVLLCATTAIALPAQTFTVLHSFHPLRDGAFPVAALVQATDGNLYGTTWGGGASATACNGSGCGTVFKITPSGRLTKLYSFCPQRDGCTDGANPNTALVQATDGNFYGTTYYGGAFGNGTVFKITPSGTLTTLYSFCPEGDGCTDGANPNAALVQATDGNFYGTTNEYGAFGFGTVFKITPSGTLTTLYGFCSESQCRDGQFPNALVQATDGNLYGTTLSGGANGRQLGTVFKITPSGTLTTLHSFDWTDGDFPSAALVQATDGNLYGTTEFGGTNGRGTVFRMTPSGTLTTLYSFCSQSGTACTDGAYPESLVQATDGNFYGTTYQGGANGYDGTVFRITPSGTLTTLYSFCSQSDCTDGANPKAGLVQDTNGTLYGTMGDGGADDDGTVFSLDVGLGPFVETRPAVRKVGARVEILGTHLSGATSVSFNGTAALFTVHHLGSWIATTLPEGATTGPVEVVTPGGTLSSNVPFRVRPLISSFSPTSGPAGTTVTITGNSLTQTTKVAFCGVEATSFTVDSDTQVTVTVPASANNGHIAITTAGGKVWSAGTFTLTP